MNLSKDIIALVLQGIRSWDDWIQNSFYRSTVVKVTVEYDHVESDTDSYGSDSGAVVMIFKVEFADDAPRYFRKKGYYSSYDGYTWEGTFEEVRPKEIAKTVYEVVS